jgi:hypothetical protein
MQYEETVVLETMTCCNCGMTFAMPERYLRKLREQGDAFYCPAGHGQHFRDSEVARLKKEVAAAQRQTEQYKGWYKAEQGDHEHTRNRLRATKGVLTKTKKRVAAGVCPCCNRSFQDLARHMAGQHPEYVEQEDE